MTKEIGILEPQQYNEQTTRKQIEQERTTYISKEKENTKTSSIAITQIEEAILITTSLQRTTKLR